jgi:eukaryotic-like serine/threonine-protein kinase
MGQADRLINIFNEARARPAGPERDQFLGQACQQDAELNRQVQSLLHAHEGAGDFLKPTYDPPALEPGEEVGDFIGRYKIRELLGEGGCGAVYVAEQQEPVRRLVALKVIKLGMDTRAVVTRFEAERQALAMMDHPNIAKVLDGGTTHTGRPYFVMELVRGLRITDYCNENKLSTNQRLELLIQVCQAIQHAHQKGVVHRDIKPSNILVTLHDGVPVPRVIDFGIAKAIEGKLTDATVYTQLHQFIGTPAYMSPEQAEMSGLDIDTRSDIYSLGVLLYELLTGRTPFDEKELLSQGLDAMRRTIREKEPVRPSTLLSRRSGTRVHGTVPAVPASEVDSDLDWIAMKCLEKDRRRRYETANGLAADLQRYLTNEPVVARPPSAFYRFQKALRRHKVAFATTTAVTVSLVVGLLAAYRAQKSAERQVYIAKMNLAGKAWNENNGGKIRELLAETADESDRGFEYYYWQRQAHLDLKTLTGHLGPVAAVAYSPDGSRIATGSFDRTVKLWEAERGAELFTLTGHRRAIRAVCFSPDGLRVATGSEDQTAIIWDVATGQNLVKLRGHEDHVISVAFSADGQRLATASPDKTARVWDTTTGALLYRIDHWTEVWTAVFTSDGRRLLTATADEEAVLWDLDRCAILLNFPAPTARVASRSRFTPPVPFTAAFSPDERWIATGSHDQKALVWNMVAGGDPFLLQANAHWVSPRQTQIPFAVGFSADSERLVTGSLDQSAMLWSVKEKASIFNLKGHGAEVTSVAFSPDGRRVVTGSYDNTVKIWDATQSREALVLHGHDEIISSAAFSSNGQQIATASWDKSVKIWDAATGRFLRQLDDQSELWGIAFSPDGERLVTACRNGRATVWDLHSDQKPFRLEGHTDQVVAVAFSPDGKWILTGAEDGTARLWDAFTGKPLHILQPHSEKYVRTAVFSPDGKQVATGSEDGIPTTNEDGTIVIWDAATGARLFAIEGTQGGIDCLAWSPDGKLLASGSIDRTAKIWNIASRRCLHTLTGHRSQVIRVFFSPDGRRVVTGGFDHTTRVWDTATGQELLTIHGHIAIALSRDGASFVTAAEPPAKVFRNATPEEVAGWRREALADDARLRRAAIDRQAHDRASAVHEWLVLGPFPFQGTNGIAALDQSLLPDERVLRPRAGDRVKVGQHERSWAVVRPAGLKIDFRALFTEPTENQLAYAVCYIVSENSRDDFVLHVGSDDQARVLLNGVEVLRQSDTFGWDPDLTQANGLRLRRGINTLVFKVANENLAWAGSVRLTDANDRPLKGVRFTTDPTNDL